MKKIFVWLLITIGKMPVVLAEKMNISGIKPLTSYMVLALVPAKVLAQHLRKHLLRAALLQKQQVLPARRQVLNNIRYSNAVNAVSENTYRIGRYFF